MPNFHVNETPAGSCAFNSSDPVMNPAPPAEISPEPFCWIMIQKVLSDQPGQHLLYSSRGAQPLFTCAAFFSILGKRAATSMIKTVVLTLAICSTSPGFILKRRRVLPLDQFKAETDLHPYRGCGGYGEC